MIPMGSVMTACMIAGLFVAVPPMEKGCPQPIRVIIGAILLAAGLWNILWYAKPTYYRVLGACCLLFWCVDGDYFNLYY